MKGPRCKDLVLALCLGFVKKWTGINCRTKTNTWFPLSSLLILAIGAGAIGCSVFSALSCEFIGVEKVQVDDLFPDSSYLTEIGIFYYSSAIESCSLYNTQFIQTSKFNSFFIISQIASLSAPLLGLASWTLVLSELMISCCKFQGSFLLQNLLFLSAFGELWTIRGEQIMNHIIWPSFLVQ